MEISKVDWIGEKLVNALKINKSFAFTGKIGIDVKGKTRQNAENKQTFDLNEKIGIEGKTRQTIGSWYQIDVDWIALVQCVAYPSTFHKLAF